MDTMEPIEPPAEDVTSASDPAARPAPTRRRPPWLVPLMIGGVTLAVTMTVSMAIGVTVVLPWLFGGGDAKGDNGSANGDRSEGQHVTAGAADGAHRWVGLWETTTMPPGLRGQGIQPVNLVMQVTPDRFYSVAVREAQDLDLDGLPDPFVLGVLEAGGGKWSTKTFRGAPGQGTYRFEDGEINVALHVVDAQQHEVTWTPTSFEALPKLGGSLPVRVPGVDMTDAPVLPFIAMGRAMAKDWKEDAVLLRVQVRNPRVGGRLNLMHRDPSSVSMTFYSPSTYEKLAISTFGDKLHPHEMGPSMPHDDTPIPDAVMELDEAMRLASETSGQTGLWKEAELAAHLADDGRKVGWNLIPDPNMKVQRPAGPTVPGTYPGGGQVVTVERAARPRAVLIDAVSGATVSTAKLEQQYIDDYNNLANRAATSLRNLIRSAHATPSVPGAMPPSLSWTSSDSGRSTSTGTDGSPAYDATNDALQRAWEAGDMQAYDRIAGGTGSDTDRSRYGY